MLDNIWSQLTNGNKLATAGAIFATFGFFSTWAYETSNGFITAEIGGLQLTKSNPIIILVLIASLTALSFLYLAYTNNQVTVFDTYGFIGLGLVALFVLFVGFSSFAQSVEEVEIIYRPVMWSVILGHVSILVGGYLNTKNLG